MILTKGFVGGLVHADTLTHVLLVLLLYMVHLHVRTRRTVPTLNKLSIWCLFVEDQVLCIRGEEALGPQAILEKGQGNAPSNLDILSLATTPIDLSVLEWELASYVSPDRDCILDGLRMDFLCNTQALKLLLTQKNLKSANDMPHIVQNKIDKEILEGRVAVPFPERPIDTLRVSPIGLVPKKTPGEYRLIHHLSYPRGFSVNDFIDPQLASVQYTSFDEAVSMMQDLGPNYKLFKMDLKNAFQLLPVKTKWFPAARFQI